MLYSRLPVFGLLISVAAGLAACGGGATTASLGLPSPPALPGLDKMAKLPELPKVAASVGHAELPTTEVYALIARGATSCWFGAGGALKTSHVFYADADPPSVGGKAEIALLERDPTAQGNRGNKTYRVSLMAEGTGTRIELTNHKLSDEVATAVAGDVHRFAAGDLKCAEAGATAQIIEPVAVPAAEAKGRKAPPKRTAKAG